MGVGKNISGGNNSSSVAPVVTDNPVFKFKIIDVDHRMEQKTSDPEEREETIKIGEPIQGNKLGDKKVHRGRIKKFEKDSEGDLLYIMIINEKGENVKIDPASIEKLNLNNGSIKNESVDRKVLLYEQWLFTQ